MPYKDPEKRKEAQRKYRERNREKLNEWDREYRKSPKGVEKQKRRYAALKSDSERWKAKLEMDRANARKYRDRKRAEIISMLGGRCVVCGFSDFRALQIDHVNGGGSQERKAVSSMSSYYDNVLKSGGIGYQLLCANCNQIKRYESGEGYNPDR